MAAFWQTYTLLVLFLWVFHRVGDAFQVAQNVTPQAVLGENVQEDGQELFACLSGSANMMESRSLRSPRGCTGGST